MLDGNYFSASFNSDSAKNNNFFCILTI